MPDADSSARVRRVSSQQIRSAVASTSCARGDRSPRLPIGVATSTSWPRRSSLTACRLRHRSRPRTARAGRPPHAPALERPGLGLDGTPGGPPTQGDAPRLEPGDSHHGEVRRQKRHVNGEFHADGMHRSEAVDVQGALAAGAAAERAALGRRVGQLERTHHIAVPQQPSGPHPPEATGRPAAFGLSSPLHVEANGQAQAQDEEEGQPRQEAELRPRLRPR